MLSLIFTECLNKQARLVVASVTDLYLSALNTTVELIAQTPLGRISPAKW
jgi:hypothetical protein